MFTQRCLNSDSKCVCAEHEIEFLREEVGEGLFPRVCAGARKWAWGGWLGLWQSHRVTDSHKALSGCPAMC